MFWLGFGLLFIALFLYLLYAFEHQTRIDRLTHNWPAPPSLPIIGHLHIMWGLVGPHPIRRATELTTKHMKDHRIKLWMGNKLYLVDCNPKDIQALCSAKQLLQKTTDYKVFENWLGEGIFTSGFEKWSHRRKIVMQALNYAKINQFVKVFEKQSQILVRRLGDFSVSGEPVDYFYVISCFTLDTICETALGASENAQLNEKSDFLNAVKEILIIIDRRLKNIFYRNARIFKFSRHFKREKELLKTLHGFTEGIIQRRMEKLRQDEENRNVTTLDATDLEDDRQSSCYLDTLFQATGPDGQPFSAHDIREEVDTIIFGGFDLTANALNFFMYNMTMHPEYQARCREEVWAVCGRDASEPVTLEQVRKLDFLEACIKESLRMYPPGPLVSRKATANCQINDFFIPKGADVLISSLYMGRCKEFFPDPMTFKPDRWASGAEPKIDASTFIPFMKGSRSCMGQRYVMVMMKMCMAHLLRNYKFEPLGERQEKMKCSFTIMLHTLEPYLCRVRKIE